jgi:hypothetical protein
VGEGFQTCAPPVVASEPRWRWTAGLRRRGQTLTSVRWRRHARFSAVERRGGRQRARGAAEGRRRSLRVRMVAGGGEGRRQTARPRWTVC